MKDLINNDYNDDDVTSIMNNVEQNASSDQANHIPKALIEVKKRKAHIPGPTSTSNFHIKSGALGSISIDELPFIPQMDSSSRLLESGRDTSSDERDDFNYDGSGAYSWSDYDIPGRENSKNRSDASNVALLLFLYVLQGIPLGLSGAVPLILQQNGHVSYKEQALFSLVFWPFSFKLLWAPLVDATYWNRVGWRKSWLVPVQYAIGAVLLLLSRSGTGLVERAADHWPSLVTLTAAFFALNFLAATQDIAVDGWALTMLARRNVGLASTCNSIGQTAGYFLGNVMFLALESAHFCNKFLRKVPSSTGIFTFSDFLHFWGLFFIASTTLVWILKKEKPHYPKANSVNTVVADISQVYKTLWDIVKLPQVQSYAVICLTMKVAFSAADSVTGLKLMDAGVSKEKLALLAVPLIPLQIIFPLIVSKHTNSQRPIDLILKAYPYRLLMGAVFAVIVWWTPSVASDDNPPHFATYFYVVIFLAYAFHQATLYSMYVAIMAFHARISDPVIGGTYMTLLNTLSNFGGNWPSTVALWLVEGLGIKRCPRLSYASVTFWSQCAFSTIVNSNVSTNSTNTANASLVNSTVESTAHETIVSKVCRDCVNLIDGYYVESALCVIIGLAWLRWKGKTFARLQDLPLSMWKVAGSSLGRHPKK